MALRNEINETILSACKALLPDIQWTYRLVGAERSKNIQGTISCDRIDILNKSKDLTHALGKYEIFIIDFTGNYDVDTASDTIVDAFNKTNMGGLCLSSEVTRIVYGSAQGYRDSNVCMISLEIEFQYDIKKGE